jgi:Flp pilus assembly protein TadG
MFTNLRNSIQPLKAFLHNKKGVAAVEFALIAPFMIALYIGSVEISQGITIDRKVSHSSSALADLITQEVSVNNAQLDNIMDATSAFLLPYDTNNLSIVLVGVQIDGDGNASVAWGYGRNGTPPGNGSAYPIPASLAVPNTFLVAADVTYDYDALFGKYFVGTVELDEDFILRPRRSDAITFE